ncbi:flagella biosynthesis protein FliZ [Anoxybacillus flavithermus]|uniref:Flagella biosynthesis protein FliZ n=1 Tax=Anoxybacillus flavithermus TaxID=33934 RepID=A0A2G5RTF3_9BACL|nr:MULTISPECIES: flagella biosynthesis regulatory protein FliZ [Anoxybacillus]KFZ43330.1 flagella biosynthesis protein FliZ [Anoxybacillus sp. KU2-6(11)]PIC05993.1 flagella biosynthesis protein FliZ [Anoxybacillus flavithermus]
MRYIRIIMLCAFVVLQAVSPAFAEQTNSVKECVEHPEKCQEQQTDKATESEIVAQPSPITVWDFVKLIAATAFVVLLLYALLKWLNKQNRFYERKGLIQHLGGTSLGMNRTIQIVKVGRRVFVVGVGESIHLLKEITDEQEIEELLKQHEARLDSLLDKNVWKSLQSFLQRKTNEPRFRQLFDRELQQLAEKRKQAMRALEKERDPHE